MYIFLDESGVDKRVGKSSIALVYLEVEHLEKLEKSILDIEKKLGIQYFHWSHSTWNVRNEFVAEVCRQNFSIKIALIKNPFYADKAYEYALQHLVIEKNISNLIIDGKKSKSYERKLKKVLRDKRISIKKLKTANDKNSPCLRVADAVAGIARYRYENPENEKIKQLYNFIENKILITLEE